MLWDGTFYHHPRRCAAWQVDNLDCKRNKDLGEDSANPDGSNLGFPSWPTIPVRPEEWFANPGKSIHLLTRTVNQPNYLLRNTLQRYLTSPISKRAFLTLLNTRSCQVGQISLVFQTVRLSVSR